MKFIRVALPLVALTKVVIVLTACNPSQSVYQPAPVVYQQPVHENSAVNFATGIAVGAMIANSNRPVETRVETRTVQAPAPAPSPAIVHPRPAVTAAAPVTSRPPATTVAPSPAIVTPAPKVVAPTFNSQLYLLRPTQLRLLL